MIDTFSAAAAIVFPEEGPYSLDPGDPGGETKWGIARTAHPEIPDETWATFTRADALAIYQTQYWDKNRCGEMPWCWALAVFDGAVNQGTGIVQLAQSALRLEEIDGLVGPETLAAMHVAPQYDFEQFLGYRLRAYSRLMSQQQDWLGWFTRVINIAINSATLPTGDADG